MAGYIPRRFTCRHPSK